MIKECSVCVEDGDQCRDCQEPFCSRHMKVHRRVHGIEANRVNTVQMVEALTEDDDIEWNDWEQTFIRSMATNLEKGFGFTPTQTTKIEELYEKLYP